MDLEKTITKAREISRTNWLHAVHLLNSAKDHHPNDQRLQTVLADLYFSRMQFSHALKYYLKALSADPGNSRIIQAVGNCYLSRHDYRLALAYYKRIPNPADDVLYSIGYTQAFLGKREDCIKTMKKLLKRLPQHPYLYFVLVEQYFELGKLDEALYYVKKSEKMAGPHVQTYLMAGLIYSAREWWLQTYYYYSKAESMGQINNVEHLLRYANAAHMIGRSQDSIRILLRAEKRWPYVNDVYIMLLRILIQEMRIDDAKLIAERAQENLKQMSPVLKLILKRLKYM